MSLVDLIMFSTYLLPITYIDTATQRVCFEWFIGEILLSSPEHSISSYTFISDLIKKLLYFARCSEFKWGLSVTCHSVKLMWCCHNLWKNTCKTCSTVEFPLPQNKTKNPKCDFWHCKISHGFCKFEWSDLLRKGSFGLLSICQSVLNSGLISQALKKIFISPRLLERPFAHITAIYIICLNRKNI